MIHHTHPAWGAAQVRWDTEGTFVWFTVYLAAPDSVVAYKLLVEACGV